MSGARPGWNLNLHYHRIVHGAVPDGARTALDVGSGDGLLSFELAERGLAVVGIDSHAPSVERARSSGQVSTQTTFVHADVFEHRFGRRFDIVVASAMLHHVDARRGLCRLRELVEPGGVLVIVGFAQPDGFVDRVLVGVGTMLRRTQEWRGRYWEHHAPVCWPPPMTTSEMRSLIAVELPGARFRRRMGSRYSVVWRTPA